MLSSIKELGNVLLSFLAGTAAFVLTLLACLLLKSMSEQIAASLAIGLLALFVVWIATERPSTGHTKATKALIDRLLAVGEGDLQSPTPPIVSKEMPALASAVDELFGHVRSNIENVQALAMYDPVTSLPNRLHFRREAERVLAEHRDRAGVALLFIDLDGFKEVNDTLGHAQGDKVLGMVANRLRVVVKAETEPGSLFPPVIARLAGDEFTLLFPGVGDAGEAERIARRATAALSEPFEGAEQRIDLGASIGIALAPQHGHELTNLMKAADIAMYQAKASGRSQVCLYRPEFAAAFEARAQTEKMLREAIVRREFALAFQPEICARSGAVVAAEALLRWHHPDGSIRTPDSFLGAAEETRLLVDIGEWVLEEAAATLGRWRAAGRTQRLALCVDAHQLERPAFFRKLRDAFARHGSPLSMLELEFAEAMAMKWGKSTVSELAVLREQGVSIAIDDFGSGYSNLARLNDMPLDRVRIGSGLIQDVDRSAGARTIVGALIHLIHGLQCEVVGQGVERQSQIDVLRAIGCDTFQGDAFAPPMPETEFMAWVTERTPARPPERLRIA